jgi:hypothetical protein
MVLDLCQSIPGSSSEDKLIWQILMGVLTLVSGVLGYIFVPNFPEKATFLNQEERQLVNDRITVDRHDFEQETLDFRKALRHLADWKIWS